MRIINFVNNCRAIYNATDLGYDFLKAPKAFSNLFFAQHIVNSPSTVKKIALKVAKFFVDVLLTTLDGLTLLLKATFGILNLKYNHHVMRGQAEAYIRQFRSPNDRVILHHDNRYKINEGISKIDPTLSLLEYNKACIKVITDYYSSKYQKLKPLGILQRHLLAKHHPDMLAHDVNTVQISIMSMDESSHENDPREILRLLGFQQKHA